MSGPPDICGAFTELFHAKEALRLRSDDASFTEAGEKSIQRRKFQTEGVQQLGADACLAEMPVDGFVSVARIPDQGKAQRRHLGADLMGLSGEQLTSRKEQSS